MILKEYFYNVQCDHCQTIASPDLWSVDEEEARTNAEDWFEHKGKHYCTDCWQYDDEDNVILADGTTIKQEEM